jgi:uncharacterized protein (DUF433 family)
MNDQTLISRDPEILSGTPVFAGTRVPARTLFDYLEEGHNLNEFLDDFPTVRREQAHAVLELFRRALLEQPYESAA